VRIVEFHPEAEAELVSAARYYEEHAENLGVDLLAAVPESGHPFGLRLRRVLVPGFPYGLIYRAEADRILIVAVAHLHRRPGYWRRRS